MSFQGLILHTNFLKQHLILHTVISIKLNLTPVHNTQAPTRLPFSPSPPCAHLRQFSLCSFALANREGVGLVSMWQQHGLGVLTEQNPWKCWFYLKKNKPPHGGLYEYKIKIHIIYGVYDHEFTPHGGLASRDKESGNTTPRQRNEAVLL